MDEPLKALREQIDAIDEQLLALLNRRAGLAHEVGRIKAEQGAPVYRPEREAEVLRRLVGMNPGPLPALGVTTVFREVMSACRALERQIRVGYLGPAGTFSEAALLKQFGASVVGVPSGSIDDVFRACEAEATDFALVPVENSTEGSVTRTMDLLLTSPLAIVAEVSMPVQHHLLTRSGTLEGVTRVCAHAQALAQCIGWLNRHHPALDRQAVASNAEAARMASVDGTVAAIAGELAASRYQLQAVASHIQDDPGNRTRFLVLGRQSTTPSGRDKTSLILAVPNRAGAVYQLLAPLADNGVSMTRFESRPAKLGAWEYYFYIDIEGHEREPHVATALGALRGMAAFFKSLGSYPAAD